MKIGFIGLGVMGGPMARRLQAKYGNVAVYDIDPAKSEALKSAGALPAKDAAEIGKSCNTVVLSLPGSSVVENVVLGSDGLRSSLEPGSAVIDTSTTEPTVTVKIAGALAERGIRFLDAPVSGGEKAAIEGTLSFMVGGDPETFEDCQDLLKAMGTTIVRVGDTGAGEVAKLVNNLIVGATFAVVAEGFALAVKSGLDPKTLYEAIRNGWAQSKVLDLSMDAVLNRNFKPGGTVNIHWKDLGYALSLAKDKDVPTPMTAITHEIFKAARAAGNGPLAQPAVVMLWEKLLGVEVK